MGQELTVVVTGSTGKQGGAVARGLLERGHRVRAVTRDPNSSHAKSLANAGATLVAASLDDSAAIKKALEGATSLFAMTMPSGGTDAETRQGIVAADAAKAAGVHLVFTSVGSANRQTGVPHFDSKYVLDFPADTNRAVAQMHYTNRFARTPNVTYIFSHAGGSIPYLAARFAIIDEMGFIASGEQRGAAADMFRRIYWDTALAASNPVLRMLRDVAGINQVLFGTDFPYLRRDLAVSSKQRIMRSSELSDSERRAILAGNASRLFSRRLSPSRNVI